jgi:DNA gyrase/topoisomerase IV subunit A
MQELSISDFLSSKYKEFSLYTLEHRAIPSVIDGLKNSQRKIIHISNQIWKSGNEKPMKIFQLAGKVASDCFYHHGNTSLEGAIINMAQSFKNNLPLLDEIGQFGSLRSPEPGAARYIGTRLNKNFNLIYKDFDLLEYKEEEGYKIEPKYFLPIIPAVLVNGSSGIAVGFAMNILNRDPLDIIEACEYIIKGKKIKSIKPYSPFFKGEWIQDKDNPKKWIIRGKYEISNTSTIKITELPPSMTYEKYETILDNLVDSKQIVSYEDNCSDNVNYTIKLTRENLSLLTDEKIIKMFKLEESETEIFTTLDEMGKVKIFESDVEIIEYFTNYRLGFYSLRKDKMLSDLRHEAKILSNKGKFIKNILDGKLEIKNKPKNEIIISIESLSIEKIDDSYDYLLRMPLWSLTFEIFEKMKKDWASLKKEIEDLEKIEPKDMYLTDLKDLKKKLN